MWRDRDRESNGQRELPVQNAGCAGEKRYRHEDRNQYEGGRDDGTRYFSHRDRRGSVGIRMVCIDVALRIFNDNDCVIDNQPGR